MVRAEYGCHFSFLSQRPSEDLVFVCIILRPESLSSCNEVTVVDTDIKENGLQQCHQMKETDHDGRLFTKYKTKYSDKMDETKNNGVWFV